MEEDSIKQNAEELFDNPPKEPNTIPIYLDSITIEYNKNVPRAELISNIIYRIIMAGKWYISKREFGDQNLSEENLRQINVYMASIGVKMNFSSKRGLICINFTPLKNNVYPDGLSNYTFPLCKATSDNVNILIT